MTEAAIDNTWYEGELAGYREDQVLPLGIGLPNQQLYVLDGRLEPAPVGVRGELCIGGGSVARGYLHKPELTAERFVEWSKDGVGGEVIRLYRTGDLARWRGNGTVEFLGRRDNQVKIRGYRIELGEIEMALAQSPEVKQAVVDVHQDGRGIKRLVGYLVPAPGATIDPARLKNDMREKLPDYMVPSTLIMLENLPVNAHGKIDRRQLPAPQFDSLEQTEEEKKELSPIEEGLIRIWKEVLGLDHLGVNDNFFELGGDSIMSIQAIARARQAGIQLTPKQLFENPTIGRLSKVVGTAQVAEADQGTVTGEVPLTPIQQWFLEQDQPNPEHWNQAVLFEVRQPLDCGILPKALAHLLEHHDALRMRFRREEERWTQTNAGVEAIEIDDLFRVVDLSGLSLEEQSAAIEGEASEVQKSLHLSEGPLLRMVYFDPGPGRYARLLIVIHHLVVDGVSWRILLEDLQTAYRQLSTGRPVALPRKTTSFKQWSELLTQYGQTDELHRELDYWIDVTHGRIAQLPKDFPAGENTEASLRKVVVTLSEEETTALLKEVPKAFGTEINDALLTALAIVLGRWKRAPEVIIDLEGHGREEIDAATDLSRTIGWFTTQFPVRLEIAKPDALGEALKQVKEQLRRIPNHGLGYTALRYLSRRPGVGDRLAALPQPAILFNYLGQYGQALAENGWFGLARESVGHSRSLRRWRSHQIEINGGIAGSRLELEWGYSELSHRRETIEALAGDFLSILRALIGFCCRPEAEGYTPSDFPDVELNEDQLEALIQGLD